MRAGVVVFPGSNCDVDCLHAVRDVLGRQAEYVWHKEEDVSGYDCLILPGGFSYGDYLRAGAIARFSPIMRGVERAAKAGKLVLGICNGFQILLEAGLLPGAMRHNVGLEFRCEFAHVRVESNRTPFTNACRPGQVLKLPIAHFQGNYYVDDRALARLAGAGRVVMRYCTREGEVCARANPNGSVGNVAAVANETLNVLGMMPHPERCCEEVLGSVDGLLIFESMARHVEGCVGNAAGAL